MDNMVYRANDIHSKEGLERLIEEEQQKEWKINERPLWRWIVVEDYSKESSYVIFVFNHCFTDGINLAGCLKFMSDGQKDMPPARDNRGVQAIPTILEPFYTLYYPAKVSLHLLSLKKTTNAMKKSGIPKKLDSHMYFLDPFDHNIFNKNRK